MPKSVATAVAPREATSDTRSALRPAASKLAAASFGGIAQRTAAVGATTTASKRNAAIGKSGPGNGRLIRESLPKHHQVGEAGGLRTRMAEEMQRNWRVLIADDDPAICTLIDTVLRKGPYDMITCNDAESALVAVDRHGPFDIIICDFMLPGISGIDLVERLRASENTRGVPILMISGHTNYAMDGRAKNAGANLFLNKPFTISQLRAAVNQLLSSSPRTDSFSGSPANR